MLWLDLIDIVYLLTGVVFGYMIFCVNHNDAIEDAIEDECTDCEYRKIIEEAIKHGEQ